MFLNCSIKNTVSKPWKQGMPEFLQGVCNSPSTGEWLNQLWYIRTLEHYSTINVETCNKLEHAMHPIPSVLGHCAQHSYWLPMFVDMLQAVCLTLASLLTVVWLSQKLIAVHKALSSFQLSMCRIWWDQLQCFLLFSSIALPCQHSGSWNFLFSIMTLVHPIGWPDLGSVPGVTMCSL